MSRHVRLSDGTVWPRPALERDDENGIAWTLTYGTPTREDLIHAASVIHAYGHLMTSTTAERRAFVVREMRAALTSTPAGMTPAESQETKS